MPTITETMTMIWMDSKRPRGRARPGPGKSAIFCGFTWTAMSSHDRMAPGLTTAAPWCGRVQISLPVTPPPLEHTTKAHLLTSWELLL